MKKWDVHGYNESVCNAFVEPPRTADMDEAKVNLERWLFYFDRFNNHEISAKLDQELVEGMAGKMLEIQQRSDLSWIEVVSFHDVSLPVIAHIYPSDPLYAKCG